MARLAELIRGFTPPTESALADPIKQHFANLPAQTAANLLRQRQNIDQALTMGNNGIEVGNQQALNEFMSEVPGVAAMTAYHGTPHTIQGKFDISKVGTGEGNQSFGHGMYFAENPEVATQYRKALSTPFKETASASQLLDMANGNYDEALKLAQKNKNIAEIHSGKTEHIESANKTLDILNKMKNGEKLEFGNLYKVDIPDEHIPNMLDWDKPLNKQSELIQNVANQLLPKIKQTSPNLDINKMTGKDFYRAYQIYRGNHADFASEGLLESGIKGIKYLDAGSRDVGKGSSNFVVFDPSTVKILEQNGQPTRKQLLEQQLNKVVE